MNSDAGTEDFFWRELNDEERKEAEKESGYMTPKQENEFLKKLNEDWQRRQSR